MAIRTSKQVSIYLEKAPKRSIAGALEWPGWCRSGKTTNEALSNLLQSGPRYALTIRTIDLSFRAPENAADFLIAEQLEGNSGTEFGVPSVVPSIDALPLDAPQLERFQAMLNVFWQALEQAAQAAEGKELRKGPRGGGRELEKILSHVLESHAGYLSALGWKHKPDMDADPAVNIRGLQEATQKGLAASVRGELPAVGPRGGARWLPRYFIRRSAWHILDHVWEIEDRIV